MAICWSDVVATFPEVREISSTAQAVVLAHVNQAFAPARFGGESSPTLRLMRLLLAAHMAEQIPDASSAGQADGLVASESVGGVSRSYVYPTTSGSDEAYKATAYGRQLASIMRSSTARVGCAF